MTDSTQQFFDQLEQRGHEPLLRRAKGTLRFDVTAGDHTDHWFVTVDRGDVAVSRGDGEAICTVRSDKKLFDGITRGEVNAMAALLRGELAFEGDPGMLLAFQRLLPAPPKASVKS